MKAELTREDFARCMAVLTAGVGKPMTERQSDVYFNALKDLPLEALQCAVRLALNENEYPTIPQIGTLRRLASEADESSSWADASRQAMAARLIAFYEPQRARGMMDKRTLAAVEAIGGIRRLADLTPESIGTYTSQLKKAYDEIGKHESRSRMLTGIVGTLAKRLENPVAAPAN